MDEPIRNSIFKTGMSVMLRSLFAIGMAFIIFVSTFFVCSFIFTNEIGYEVYVYNEETDETVKEYEYFYDSPEEDSRLIELEESGATYTKLSLRSELKGFGYGVTVIIVQGFSLLLVFTMLYPFMWKQGDSERNLGEFGHIKPDSWRGFKMGLIASIPQFVLYIGLVLCKLSVLPDGYYSIYRILNSHVFMLLTWVLGANPSLDTTSWWRIIASVLFIAVVPLCCQIGYALGARGILIKEKLVYKSKKD